MINRVIYFLVIILCLACQKEEDENIPVTDITDIEFIATVEPHGNNNSPLTAIINTTALAEHSLEIIIKGKFGNNLSYKDRNVSKSHEIPLIGLYPAYNNIIFVCAFDRDNKEIARVELEYQTDSIMVDIPEIEVIHYDSSALNGRLTFIEYRMGLYDIPFVFDEYGDVRWYLKYPDQSLIRPTVVKNTRDFYCGDLGYNVMHKFDWTGNVETFTLPDGYFMLHHEVYRYSDHLFFPSDKDFILECDEKGNKIKEWNLYEIVKSYLPVNQQLVVEGKDWLHINSVYYQQEDHSLVVSARQSLGVFKIDYNSGNIRWILNDTSLSWYSYPKLKDLALQAIEGCELPLGQHSPVPLSGNRILMFDNGYDGYERLNDEDGLTDGGKGYSRLVVYNISENTMTVSQDFQYGREQGKDLFSMYAGNAGFDQATSSYYALFGTITFTDTLALGRVIEVGTDGYLLFDARLTALDTRQFFSRGEKIDLDMIINGISNPDY